MKNIFHMPGLVLIYFAKTILNKALFLDFIHVYSLFAIAVAQPIFDILSQNGEFFVAHKSGTEEIVWFAIILSIFLPLPFVIVGIITKLINPMLYKFIYTGIICLLAMLFSIQIIKYFDVLPGEVQIILGVFTGIVSTWLYTGKKLARQFISMLSPVIVIFPVFFLVFTDISEIVFQGEIPLQISATENNNGERKYVPVVLIVMDSLNSANLMDKSRNVDPILFPNIAEFSKKAHWFRNASTVADATGYAVPAILTGLYPRLKKFPIYKHYPNTLFTLLAESRSIYSRERIQMCHPKLCKDEYEENKNLKTVFTFIGADIAAIYFNIITPSKYSEYVPDLDRGWNDFSDEYINAFAVLSNYLFFEETNQLEGNIKKITTK